MRISVVVLRTQDIERLENEGEYVSFYTKRDAPAPPVYAVTVELQDTWHSTQVLDEALRKVKTFVLDKLCAAEGENAAVVQGMALKELLRAVGNKTPDEILQIAKKLESEEGERVVEGVIR